MTKDRLIKWSFTGIVLLIVVLLFTIFDHSLHVLNDAWSVPDYYFKDKIPAAFLWGLVGLFLAKRSENVWLKALIVSGVISVTLQFRYFIEGYALSFVLSFLVFHFIILYFLSAAMFAVFKRYNHR